MRRTSQRGQVLTSGKCRMRLSAEIISAKPELPANSDCRIPVERQAVTMAHPRTRLSRAVAVEIFNSKF